MRRSSWGPRTGRPGAHERPPQGHRDRPVGGAAARVFLRRRQTDRRCRAGSAPRTATYRAGCRRGHAGGPAGGRRRRTTVYVDSAPTADTPYQRYDVTGEQGARRQDGRPELGGQGRRRPGRRPLGLGRGDAALEGGRLRRGSDRADTTLVGTTRWARRSTATSCTSSSRRVTRSPRFPSTADEAFEDPDNYDFAMAWMTDTQYLSQGGADATSRGSARPIEAINEWIVDNAAEREDRLHGAHRRHHQQLAGDRASMSPGARRVPVRQRHDGVPRRRADARTASSREPRQPDRHGQRPVQRVLRAVRGTTPRRTVAPNGEDGEGFYGGSWRPGTTRTTTTWSRPAG